jgi:hypothetical protein
MSTTENEEQKGEEQNGEEGWKSRRPSPRPIGRPTKLTAEVQQTIAEWVKNGMFQDQAAALANVSRATYFNWKAQGAVDREKGVKSAYTDFLDAMEEAETFGEAYLFDKVVKMGLKENFQALKYALQVKNRDRYVVAEKMDMNQVAHITVINPEDYEGAGGNGNGDGEKDGLQD